MQISRHWRMNSQRYRLEGVRYENGEVNLQARPVPQGSEVQQDTRATETRQETEAVRAVA